VAHTFQDRYYHSPSSDLGFIAYYRLNDWLKLDAALTNGEGMRINQDKYGKVKVATGIDIVPTDKIQVRVFYDNAASGDSLSNAQQQLFSVYTGYKWKEKFRIGSEFNYRFNHNNKVEQDLFGYSIFGCYQIFKKTSFFARFDHLMSNTLPGEKQKWNVNGDGSAIITGINYSPTIGVNVSMNYQSWIPEDKAMETQNHILLSMEFKL